MTGDRAGTRRRLLPWAPWALAVFALALAVRLATAGFQPDINSDGTHIYLTTALRLSRGDFDGGIHVQKPPVYPLLVAAVYRTLPVTLDWAGRIVSSIAGALVAVAALGMGSRAFGPAAGRWAGLLVAIGPQLVRYGGRSQSEATYGLFYLLAIWGVLEFLRARPGAGRAVGLGLWVGAASGLGYMTRTEGLGLAAVAGGAALLRAFPLRRRLLSSALFAIIAVSLALAIALPYIAKVHEKTGIWSLGNKGGQANLWLDPERKRKLIELTPDHRSYYLLAYLERPEMYVPFSLARILREHGGEFARVYLKRLAKYGSLFVRALGPALAGLVLALVIRRSVPRQAGAVALILAATGFFVAVFCLFYDLFRLTIPLAGPLHVLAAAGLLELAGLLRRVPRRRILAAYALVCVPFLLRPMAKAEWTWYGTAKIRAGVWIRDRFPEAERVLSPTGEIASYAGKEAIFFPMGPYDGIIEYARYHHVDLVAFSPRELDALRPGFREAMRDEDLRLLARLKPRAGERGTGGRGRPGDGAGEILVYRLGPAPEATRRSTPRRSRG